MSEWSVYIHINKINNKKYVGITSQEPERRWGSNGCKYQSGVFKNAINKYGWDKFYHIVLCTGKTEEEAKEIEKYLIDVCDSKLPNGYNMTFGGEGTLGLEISDETKAKMSVASSAKWENESFRNKMTAIRNDPDGVYQSKEFKDKISSLVSGENNPNYQHYWSDEQKEKLRIKQENNPLYKGGSNPNAKKIMCVETGEVFPCMEYAREKYGLKSTGSFNIAIKYPGRTAAGYHWKYV